MPGELLAAWPFDTDGVDVTGGGKDVVIGAGNGGSSLVAGKHGNAITHSAGTVAGPSPAGLLTAQRTLMAWIRNTGSITDGRAVEFTASDGNSIWEFLFRADLWHIQAWNASTFARATISRPTDSLPHHVAGTYDGTHLRIYLDGVQVGAAVALAGPLRTDANALRFLQQTGSGFWFDDVRLYDGALTGPEIQALMDVPAGEEDSADPAELNGSFSSPTVAAEGVATAEASVGGIFATPEVSIAGDSIATGTIAGGFAAPNMSGSGESSAAGQLAGAFAAVTLGMVGGTPLEDMPHVEVEITQNTTDWIGFTGGPDWISITGGDMRKEWRQLTEEFIDFTMTLTADELDVPTVESYVLEVAVNDTDTTPAEEAWVTPTETPEYQVVTEPEEGVAVSVKHLYEAEVLGPKHVFMRLSAPPQTIVRKAVAFNVK